MWRLISVALLALTMVLPALAQEEPQERQWTFRIGSWYPSSGDVRMATSDMWVYIGVERTFPGLGDISLDYTEGSGTITVRQLALFYNSRQKYTPRLDLIGGIGIVNARVKKPGVSETRLRSGVTMGIAWFLQPRAEVQLRYQTGGFREVNGFVLTLNFRF